MSDSLLTRNRSLTISRGLMDSHNAQHNKKSQTIKTYLQKKILRIHRSNDEYAI